jgi:hypothetical protein
MGAGAAALGALGAGAAVAEVAAGASAGATRIERVDASWDLSWVKRVEAASDRAVFDNTQISDGIALDIATRYLDNCVAAYGSDAKACAVLNVRTRAIALGFTDAMWSKYELGSEYTVQDPVTKKPALRNPFLTVNPGAYPGTGSINELVRRGSVFLVCDFALGHLANRLAAKAGRSADEVHEEIKSSLVPGAYMVPSGIFGSARAQNAGAALIVT